MNLYLFTNLSLIMKYSMLLILASCFIGCSATNTVTMSVQEPAVVELSPAMERIGIINRSEPGDQASVMDRVDQIFSAEGKNLDSEGSRQSITALEDEFKQNERFAVVQLLDNEQLENPAFGVFPARLSWDEISDICAHQNLDGLFSLEFYDTDSKIDYSTERVTVEGPLGIEIPALEHQATVQTTIKTGWRIYDNVSKNLLDEFVVTEHFTTTGKGINPTEAVSAITGRIELVKDISYQIGQHYAGRTLPYWIRVRRDYYVKGNDNFERAKRRAQTGNWDGAAEIWLQETENPKSKVAGRAHYNMAIISEINGELDEAIGWARKSYEDYGDKRALKYQRVLQRRKESMAALARQQQ